MLIKHIHHPQRDAVVILALQRLHSRVVGFQEGFVGVFVEQACTNGHQRVLVTQFSMDAFPDADSGIGANAEVVASVAVGVGNHLWNQLFDGCILRIACRVQHFGQFLDVGRLTDVGKVFGFIPPMDLSVAQTDG